MMKYRKQLLSSFAIPPSLLQGDTQHLSRFLKKIQPLSLDDIVFGIPYSGIILASI